MKTRRRVESTTFMVKLLRSGEEKSFASRKLEGNNITIQLRREWGEEDVSIHCRIVLYACRYVLALHCISGWLVGWLVAVWSVHSFTSLTKKNGTECQFLQLRNDLEKITNQPTTYASKRFVVSREERRYHNYLKRDIRIVGLNRTFCS